MKTYISLLLVVAGLVVIVLGGYIYMKHKAPTVEKTPVKTIVQMRTVSGQVVRTFEGENKIEYAFDVPDNATTSVEMDGALVRVKQATSSLATVYFSYEGGRGYTPADYLLQVVAPRVAVTLLATTTIGAYEWQTAESTGSEWHIAQTGNNGQWLVVVENKKSMHQAALDMLESFDVK